MSVAKVLVIGAVGAGLVALFMHSSKANATSSSTLPPNWQPPIGAKVETLQTPVAGTGIAQLKRTSWHVPADASGQQAGTFVLTQNAADPNDWVMGFASDAGGNGILAFSQTPNGGLLAQAAAAGF